jgi:excisionase family DNA binding protein
LRFRTQYSILKVTAFNQVAGPAGRFSFGGPGVAGVAMDEVEVGLLTVSEAARLLRLSAAAVYALCKTAELPHHRMGSGRSAIRISRVDILAYLARTKQGAAPDGGPPPAPAGGKGGLPPAGGFKHLRVDRLLGTPPRGGEPPSGRGGRNG